VGGADARRLWPRGGGRGSQLHLDVWGAGASGQDRQRDVAALAEACRLGIYRPAHRVSAGQRQQRRELRVREQLVRVRTQAITLLRAQLRQEGYRLASGSAETAVARYERLAVPAALHQVLPPLLELLRHLAPTLAQAAETRRTRAAADPIARRLMTAPGIGPITALTYRATVDTIDRFADAGSASAFFGLVPREDSSGERQRRGRITKAGPPMARSLLIQAAWGVWRHRAAGGQLHAWVLRLADRRGKGKVSAVRSWIASTVVTEMAPRPHASHCAPVSEPHPSRARIEG